MLFKNGKLFVVNFVLSLVLLGGMFVRVPAVQASTLTVTNTNNSGAGSLRQAITNAVSGDTIIFNPALAGQTITLSSTLVVNKNMTINGNTLASKVSVSGNNSVRVFEVISGITLTLDSLKVRNGFSSLEQGSGVLNSGTLNIKNSIFSGNVARHGGAIKNTGTLNIANSTFSGNSASGPANTSAYGGGVYNSFGTLNIENSTFAGNTASPFGGGGGIFHRSGTLSIINSTFSGNDASQGGAVNNNAEGTATIVNSNFSGNSAEYGGGILNYETLNITGSTFSSNSAIGGGGGIRNHGMLSLTNSTISSNSSGGDSTSSDGGGVYNDGTMTTTNTTFSDNLSNSNAGGIYNANSLTIVNSTFSGNIATSGRGILSGGILNITNSTFSDGGVFNVGTLNSRNNIFANSTPGSDCYNNGTIGININNLVETNSAPPNNCGTPTLTIDPKLGPLADNGGPNQTLALLTESPALDAGDNATCPSTDQRGVARPQGASCDIGAYEYEPAVVQVNIAGNNVGNYMVAPKSSLRQSYAGLDNGPVRVTSTLPMVASERVAYSPDGGTTWTSYSELMGLPSNQLATSYTFPWYNNLDLNSQLRFGNVGTANTTVTVTVGGVFKGAYNLIPNQSQRISYAGLDAGPVKVTSSGNVPIIASMRVAYFDGSAWTSFSEMMGLPSPKLTTSYVFPWYNNVDLNSQLRFGNVGGAPTTVTVTIGGVFKGSYQLAVNESKRISYPTLDKGPVKVTSSGNVPIIASMRVAYFDGSAWTDFSEMMGMPSSSLGTHYSFPVYNNVNLNTQLRFGNVGAANTVVTVRVNGVLKGTYNLAPNASQRISYAGLDAGPVVIQSSGNVPIIASERVAYFNGSAWTSFAEMMGLPQAQLSTTYLFPWYNNIDLNTQLRFGVP